MKQCLVDVNVIFAILLRQHEHHRIARRWYETLKSGEVGLCRFTQLALLRLLCNPSILRDDAMSASGAWMLVDELLQDERLELLPEPADLGTVMPSLLNYRVPTIKLITDAYLAAFAMASSRCLITFDKGFKQFPGLDTNILKP